MGIEDVMLTPTHSPLPTPTSTSTPSDSEVELSPPNSFAKSAYMYDSNAATPTPSPSNQLEAESIDRDTMLLPRASLASVRSWRGALGLRDERLALRSPEASFLSASQSNDTTRTPAETEAEAEADTEDDIDQSAETSDNSLFPASSLRVWKQVSPPWVNLYLPRFVKLQSGPRPYVEYRRHKASRVRQRVYLTPATRVVREAKDKLVLEFVPTTSHADLSSKTNAKAINLNSNQIPPSNQDGYGYGFGSSASKVEQWRLRFESKRERDVWCKKLQDAVELLAWIGKYKLGNVIMETETSRVVECFSWMDEDKPSYVMKVINTCAQSASSVRNELRLHHALTNFSSHPNILTLHDSFRSNDRACLVVDYCAGGDLFEALRAHGRMEEATAQRLFRFIAQAVVYIHEHKIVHLDLKPENLLFKSSFEHLHSVKVADFGSAQSIAGSNARSVRQVSYTVGYAAPEVLRANEVSFAADVFSAGAVLYTMLCGHGPFQSDSREHTMQLNLEAKVPQDEDDFAWACPSASAKELLRGMLHPDPTLRWTMEQVLDHPWLNLN